MYFKNQTKEPVKEDNRMIETIYSLFHKVVSSHGGKTAIIEKERAITFEELSQLVDRIAAGFPADLNSVGIVMSHQAEMIASILAVLKCGGTYVPAEPSFPAGRIHIMMEEAEVDFILTEKEYADKLTKFPLCFIEREVFDLQGPTLERTGIQDPDRPAYILYTSGSTGRPKGVCVTNANVCHYVSAFAEEFHPSEKDCMLQHSVCSFDIFVEEVFASLLNGAALAIPSEEERANILLLMNFIEKHNVTIISGFPYLLAEMNRLSKIPASIRLLISGGDVLRESYVDHLLAQAEVYNTYGPSETTVCASYYCCNDGTALSNGTYPIGHPVKGSEIRILDQEGKELPMGEKGEICIYGKGVSLGYIGEHEEENRAFVTFADRSVMYQSGDLGYLLPDGNIAFLCRKDTQIMIYGKRVEISEVESQLHQCKDVHQAVVRAFTDEEGLSYMTAYVVPADKNMKVSAVRKELAENLTPFMIPEFIVKMPDIPLNTNGKPDISKLPVVMKVGSC